MRLGLGCVLLVALALSTPVLAVQLCCYEEPGTMKRTCFDPKAVRVNGETRAARLYQGGPVGGARETPYTFVTNCAKGVSTLQDRDGVNFAGALSSATDASRSLSQWVCDVPNPKKDPKLRQF